MTKTIELLRTAANECAVLASNPNIAKAVKFDISDVVAEWHALARNATKLCKRGKELVGGYDAECSQCTETCFGGQDPRRQRNHLVS